MVLKNTLLGAAVFETYGHTISRLAPDAGIDALDRIDPQDDGLDEDVDEYARASLYSHVQAGFVAGSVHGVLSTAVEAPSKSRSASCLRFDTSLPTRAIMDWRTPLCLQAMKEQSNL